MTELFNGMFGKVAPGMCRLSMYGGTAVRTPDGYKTYDLSTGRLLNCENFVFPVGEEFFFVIPANRLKPGDIILAGGKPKVVLEAEKNKITALNYENGVIETILPERRMFMGNIYFYGKIVSMFGSKGTKGEKGIGRVIRYMMLSQMLRGESEKGSTLQGGTVLPLMLMMGKGDGFGELFDFDSEWDDEEDAED